jgi:hypothetical protein
VKEVTGDTCAVLFGDLELTEVRLKVTKDDDLNTLIIKPKVGSMVLVGSLTGDLKDLAVMKVDVIDEIVMDVQVRVQLTCPEVVVNSKKVMIESGELSIDADSTIFNGGDNLGVPKSKSVAQKLAKIEGQLNELKAVFTSWIPVPTDGGAALKAAVTTWAADLMTPTVADNLENKSVKH